MNAESWKRQDVKMHGASKRSGYINVTTRIEKNGAL